MAELRAAILRTAFDIKPCTVRQLFYQMVNRHEVPLAKSEREYKGTIVRLVSDMRLDGTLPWDWVNDNTRWMRKPTAHGSMADILDAAAESYTRNLWSNVDEYVEIWLEKDALSGVFYDVTAPYQVPLMVTRGYPSLTYLHDAAYTMVANQKPVSIYYFGDFDPSGCDISRNTEARIRQFVADYRYPVPVKFHRVAVNEEQIHQLRLPTRPTKTTDTRISSFTGKESVEVDAIPPNTLRAMIRSCITRHIPQSEIDKQQQIQALERQSLAAVASKFKSFGGDAQAFLGAIDGVEDGGYEPSPVAVEEPPELAGTDGFDALFETFFSGFLDDFRED